MLSDPSTSAQIHRKTIVVQIIAGFSIESPLGGIERFVVELSTHLDQTKFHPVVFGLWNFETEYGEKWKKYLNQKGVETIEGAAWDVAHPYRSFIRSYRTFEKELKKRDIDILHSHNQFGDIMSLIFKWRGNTARLVRTTHNENEWQRRRLRRWFLWGLLYPLGFHQEIGINAKMIEMLDNRPVAKLMKKKSSLIPNALNLKRFAGYTNHGEAVTKLRASLNIPPGCTVVGTMGRLTLQKGFTNLIHTAKQVLQPNPMVYFVIVGSGELEIELKALAQELGVADRVIFAGSCSNVEDYYKLFDLFVSSSLWEGLPTVIMESMASGTPIVATDITGTRDLIIDGVNGWLVPPGEVNLMAEKILFALANHDICLEYVNRAFDQVNQYSIERVAQKQESLYLSLLLDQTLHED